jgi:hypothetical protein
MSTVQYALYFTDKRASLTRSQLRAIPLFTSAEIEQSAVLPPRSYEINRLMRVENAGAAMAVKSGVGTGRR